MSFRTSPCRARCRPAVGYSPLTMLCSYNLMSFVRVYTDRNGDPAQQSCAPAHFEFTASSPGRRVSRASKFRAHFRTL
eukprot:12822564-Alexandrium_andersonii.AAC.1